MAAYAGAGLTAIQALDYHNIFLEFIRNFDNHLQWFRGKRSALVGAPGIRDSQDFREFLNIAADKSDGSINAEVIHYDEGKRTSAVKYAYKPKAIQEASEGVSDHLETLGAIDTADHKQVIMQLEQLNSKKHSADGRRSSDRGRIESISEKQLSVFWLSEMDSKRVKAEQFPFRNLYVVDVKVETARGGVPKAYRIMRLHEIIEDE